jgi:hypothetical protein
MEYPEWDLRREFELFSLILGIKVDPRGKPELGIWLQTKPVSQERSGRSLMGDLVGLDQGKIFELYYYYEKQVPDIGFLKIQSMGGHGVTAKAPFWSIATPENKLVARKVLEKLVDLFIGLERQYVAESDVAEPAKISQAAFLSFLQWEAAQEMTLVRMPGLGTSVAGREWVRGCLRWRKEGIGQGELRIDFFPNGQSKLDFVFAESLTPIERLNETTGLGGILRHVVASVAAINGKDIQVEEWGTATDESMTVFKEASATIHGLEGSAPETQALLKALAAQFKLTKCR